MLSLCSFRSVFDAGNDGYCLNLGLNDDAVEGIAKKSGNERFAWDSYRRFIQMYGGVVLGMKPENKDDRDPFEEIMERAKENKGIELDTDLTVEDLKVMVKDFKQAVKQQTDTTSQNLLGINFGGAIMCSFQ